ncbi:MAG: hypothetical protein ACR2JC_00535 [Chloroflexota bacterium]
MVDDVPAHDIEALLAGDQLVLLGEEAAELGLLRLVDLGLLENAEI